MPKKILVVDDEPDIVLMVQSRLETGGYQVFTAGSGAECLVKAKECRPDLILLDVAMPEMDGFQVLSQLKNDQGMAQVPVVMLTAKGELNSIFKAKEMGAADYVVKPFKGEDLLKWVRRYA